MLILLRIYFVANSTLLVLMYLIMSLKTSPDFQVGGINIGAKKWDIYLRITDPNQHILIQNNQPVFSYEGEEIAYSSVRQVEYNGELVNAVVYFEYNEESELVTGTYNVDIFCDGNMIGAAVVELN